MKFQEEIRKEMYPPLREAIAALRKTHVPEAVRRLILLKVRVPVAAVRLTRRAVHRPEEVRPAVATVVRRREAVLHQAAVPADAEAVQAVVVVAADKKHRSLIAK